MVESAVKRNLCEKGKTASWNNNREIEIYAEFLKYFFFTNHNHTDKDLLVNEIWTGFTSWFDEKCSRSKL